MKQVIPCVVLSFMHLIQVNAQNIAPVAGFAAGAHSRSKYDFSYKEHKGIINLANGEKITGNFEYAYLEFPTYNLKQLSSDNKVEKRYKSKEVKSVVLYGSDTTLSNKDSTYFFVFKSSPNFWRQLSFDKDIQVFDWLFNVNERPGLIYPYVVVRKDNKFYDCKTPKDFINWIHKNAADKIKWSNKITVKDIIRQLNRLS